MKKPKICDIYKVVAHVNVFGMDTYGTRLTSIENGKGNLLSYFGPRGWNITRIRKVVSFLVKEEVLTKHTGHGQVGINTHYTLCPLLRKLSLKLALLDYESN